MSDLTDVAVTMTIVGGANSTLQLAGFVYLIRQGQRAAPPESQVEIIKAGAELGPRLPGSGVLKLLHHFRLR